MHSHKEYALKFLIYKFKKETVILNRTEQNRTEQNRTEQNRTEHVALHNFTSPFYFIKISLSYNRKYNNLNSIFYNFPFAECSFFTVKTYADFNELFVVAIFIFCN